MRISLALLMLLACALTVSVGAQETSQPVTATTDAEVPHITLQFDKPQKLSIGGNNVAMSGLTACVDGNTFVQLWDSENGVPTKFVIYSVDSAGKIVRFDAGKLPGYTSVGSAFKYFANGTTVVALASAQPEKKSMSDPPPNSVHLALIYDRNGKLNHSVPMPGDLKISTVGIYDSGNLLVVGTRKDEKSARLLVIGQDGDVVRELRLFDEDYNLSQHVKRDQLISNYPNFKNGALSYLQIYSYGQNLLLWPTLTRQPVLEVNEHGIVHSHQLQLPKGVFLNRPYATGKGVWIVGTLKEDTEAEKAPDAAPGTPTMTASTTLEISPFDGRVMRAIEIPDVKEGYPPMLTCEQDGEYSAITTSSQDGSLELVMAKVAK